jgi:mitogen-activated protein kinase 7
MAELISLRAIFRGTDYIDQLNKILDVIGTPSRDIVREICTGGSYSNNNARL